MGHQTIWIFWTVQLIETAEIQALVSKRFTHLGGHFSSVHTGIVPVVVFWSWVISRVMHLLASMGMHLLASMMSYAAVVKDPASATPWGPTVKTSCAKLFCRKDRK